MTLKAERSWEVKLPPVKKHMVGGKLLPTVRGAFSFAQKKRFLALEIRSSEEEPQQVSHDLLSSLQDGDEILVRILKKRKQWGFSRDNDDSSDDDDDDEPELEDERGLVEYRKYDLEEVCDFQHNKNEVEATFGRGSATEVREIKFANTQEAKNFYDQIVALKKTVDDRASQRLEAFRAKQEVVEKEVKSRAAKVGVSLEDDIKLMVEIVSCSNIPIADIKSTDPYVTVFFGTDEVHRTKPVANTVNPIWTVDNGSLFILSNNPEDFFKAASGLTFLIKDFDGLSTNEVIGKVAISQEHLLQLKGDRIEYPIQCTGDFVKRASRLAPKLTLRVRKADARDFKFIKQLHSIKKFKTAAVYLEDSFVAPKVQPFSLFQGETKKGDKGETLYRVKPRPDPTRPEEETKWMKAEQIETEHLKPSSHWIEAGSGKLGRLYLEILRCDGLENKDKGSGGKTDSFCSIVYEDAIVNTDVVNDELDPRWMSWTQRAFRFHVQHPSSQVLVGVFDYDSAKGVNAHDAIGRVSMDLTNFSADTDYVLTYDLHKSVLNENRSKAGKLTVRLRIEWKNYRQVVLSALGAPPFNYINVSEMNDFKTTFFVCNGDENLQQLNMDALKNYRDELSSYSNISYNIVDALKVVLLWRGHYHVNLLSFKFGLALHSVIAFVMGITLIENFNLLPSYSLFAIAWFMLATNEHRQHNPSPWHGSMTYGKMWYTFLAGKSPAKEICDNENEAAIRRYEASMEERRKQQAEDKERAEANAQKLSEFFANDDEGSEEVDGDLSTKMGGGPNLNPLKPILLPIQKSLGMICKTLRIVTSIITWDESMYAFMLTSICLAGGLALIWVPWDFVFRWTARILIWVMLGPWMKLVDIFYVRKLEVEGDNEAKQFQQLAEERLSTISASKQAVMMKKEDFMKLSAIKRYMFGKYVTRVPQFKEYRFPDIPLAESTATPHNKTEDGIVIAEKKHGQLLVGHMVPSWADADDEKQD